MKLLISSLIALATLAGAANASTTNESTSEWKKTCYGRYCH